MEDGFAYSWIGKGGKLCFTQILSFSDLTSSTLPSFLCKECAKRLIILNGWRKHMGIEPTGEISHPPH